MHEPFTLVQQAKNPFEKHKEEQELRLKVKTTLSCVHEMLIHAHSGNGKRMSACWRR